jgi:hypothetical protein
LSEATSHPDPKQEFRGSLIDECMFAIDMEEWGLGNVQARYRAGRTPKLSMPTGQTLAACPE